MINVHISSSWIVEHQSIRPAGAKLKGHRGRPMLSPEEVRERARLEQRRQKMKRAELSAKRKAARLVGA